MKSELILVIEDDPRIRNFLKPALVSQGYVYEEACLAETGLSLAKSLHPALVLLDLGLPDYDGLELIPSLKNLCGIVVISARGQEAEKVKALELGADDYLTKPFGLAELLARIKVTLRHRGLAELPGQDIKHFGMLTIDTSLRRVFLETEEVHLSPIEYRLLLVLARSPGKILTHSFLLEQVWGRFSQEYSHYVRITMAKLRKKLEKNPLEPRFIFTETGVGYRFFQ